MFSSVFVQTSQSCAFLILNPGIPLFSKLNNFLVNFWALESHDNINLQCIAQPKSDACDWDILAAATGHISISISMNNSPSSNIIMNTLILNATYLYKVMPK